MLGEQLRERRGSEPILLVPLAVFAIALILSITFGGSALPLELRRSVFPGALGLGCLISLAFHKPLLAIAATRFADARPEQMGGTAQRLKLPGPSER